MRSTVRLGFLGLCFFYVSASAASAPQRILILGDSLSEGYGVSREQAFPAILQTLLVEKGHPEVEVINGGISGSTSASGVPRLRWQLRQPPQIVMIALGANDGLRGLPLAETKKNIANMITLARSHHVKVLLAGMKLPPNYGPDYAEGFEAMYRDLAQQHHTPFIPFLLEGVAGNRELNIEDGMHPNEKGHAIVARHVLPYLLPLL